MNKEVKAKWVAALRSGKYKQGLFALRRASSWDVKNDVTHCCLGVLCAISPIPNPFRGGSMPSSDVQIWAGLTTRAMNHLVSLNDNHGLSFTEIADYIEKNL